MIIYDLKCENGHAFEGWFKDRQAWLVQKAQKLVTCPACNSANVEIVPSSITIMGKNARADNNAERREISPLKALQLLHEYIDKNFEDVGDKFAEVALKIHSGEEDKRNIKGTTTSQEEKNLKEEGIEFIKIPVLKMDS
ncbi:MAG TPA: DUF1178 family protein [Smithellaceae bacterium]|nr:DUF1178 family protein [Smithellaceae bacterium]HRS89270.1 DUF1178 family protein [Smithellaceae bacterium]HRV27046.1 DUF1178 family protein [Smithellaceae bacterium]